MNDPFGYISVCRVFEVSSFSAHASSIHTKDYAAHRCYHTVPKMAHLSGNQPFLSSTAIPLSSYSWPLDEQVRCIHTLKLGTRMINKSSGSPYLFGLIKIVRLCDIVCQLCSIIGGSQRPKFREWEIVLGESRRIIFQEASNLRSIALNQVCLRIVSNQAITSACLLRGFGTIKLQNTTGVVVGEGHSVPSRFGD